METGNKKIGWRLMIASCPSSQLLSVGVSGKINPKLKTLIATKSTTVYLIAVEAPNISNEEPKSNNSLK